MTKATGIHILGGGTVSHVRSHFALAATAYGKTARTLHALLKARGITSQLHLTKMACMGKSNLETNNDIINLTDKITADPACRTIVFNVAVADFEGQIGKVPSGKYAKRLKSRDATQDPLTLKPADKIVQRIKACRPDIFLVAFKTTTGEDRAEQISRGTNLMKESLADLVLANDTVSRRNILIAKDGRILCDTQDRAEALRFIADTIAALPPPPPGQKPAAPRPGDKP